MRPHSVEGDVGSAEGAFLYFLVFVRLWELAHDNITKIKRNNKLSICGIARRACGICERLKILISRGEGDYLQGSSLRVRQFII